MANGFPRALIDFEPCQLQNTASEVAEFDNQQWLLSQPYTDPWGRAAARDLFPTPTSTNQCVQSWPISPTTMGDSRNTFANRSSFSQTMSSTSIRPNKRTRAESPSCSTTTPTSKRLKATTTRKQKKSHTMTKSAVDDPVDYKDLKAWIAEQESLPSPAPLTDVQRRAIADLRDSLKTRAVPKVEIDLGDKDWVSLLHRYRDAHQQVGVSVEFHEDAGPNLQWMCYCTIRSSIPDEEGHSMDRRFPHLDYGFIPMSPDGGLRQPTFARKKDAKRYAAKCCIEYLMSKGLMPLDGENVSFPKRKLAPPSPKNNKRPNPVSETTITGSSAAKSAVSHSLPSKNQSAPSDRASTPAETTDKTEQKAQDGNSKISIGERVESSGGGAPLDVRDEDFSATDRVLEMCDRLGISKPSYKIDRADPAIANIFNGYADFGLDNVLIPDNVGRVSNCYGGKFTKEKVAEEVLEHLIKLEAQRNVAADELIRLMDSREFVSEL